jgi:hypothetical protein
MALVTLWAALGACVNAPPREPLNIERSEELAEGGVFHEARRDFEDLILTLVVTPEASRVRLHLRVQARQPVELEFSSSQRYDFAMANNGSEVWRWSEDKVFAQVLGTESLGPGEAPLEYEEIWQPAPPGRYRAVATITARDRSELEVEQSFEVD